MSRRLTDEDYCRAAKRFNCKVAAIKAVAQVESAGSGFLPDGRCIILFERHYFSRLTHRRFDAQYPQISNRDAGGYYGKEKEYQRFNLAFSLDPLAAMMSCSWGKFQIMGSNHAICGYASIHEFVDAMKRSEGDQLDAFCGFVDHNNLDDELRRLDWAGFARGYNGKGYKKNRYDEKMAVAYQKFAKENINCGDILDLTPENVGAIIDAQRTDSPVAVQPPLGSEQNDPLNDQQQPVENPPAQQPASNSSAQDVTVTDKSTWFGTKLGGIVSGIFTGAYVIPQFNLSETHMDLFKLLLPYIAIGLPLVLLGWYAVKKWDLFKKLELQVTTNTNPNMANMAWDNPSATSQLASFVGAYAWTVLIIFTLGIVARAT